jgi:hypothetical protein
MVVRELFITLPSSIYPTVDLLLFISLCASADIAIEMISARNKYFFIEK